VWSRGAWVWAVPGGRRRTWWSVAVSATAHKNYFHRGSKPTKKPNPIPQKYLGRAATMAGLKPSHGRTAHRKPGTALLRKKKNLFICLTNQRINESTNQRINESTNQRINESTNQRINESTNQRINESTNQRINESKIPAQNQSIQENKKLTTPHPAKIYFHRGSKSTELLSQKQQQ
jgi:hypothetical protein